MIQQHDIKMEFNELPLEVNIKYVKLSVDYNLKIKDNSPVTEYYTQPIEENFVVESISLESLFS